MYLFNQVDTLFFSLWTQIHLTTCCFTLSISSFLLSCLSLSLQHCLLRTTIHEQASYVMADCFRSKLAQNATVETINRFTRYSLQDNASMSASRIFRGPSGFAEAPSCVSPGCGSCCA